MTVSHARRVDRRPMAMAVAAVILAAILAMGAARAAPAPESFADTVEKLLPAVVNISTTTTAKAQQRAPEVPQLPPGSPFEQFFKDFMERRGQPDAPPRKLTSLGSGFIIDPAGYVVTNNHVIEDADEITVTMGDDRTYPAKLVGRDGKTDLALLKIEAGRPLPFVSWGDSSIMRIGDWVIAIGNPFGLGGTVTAGIVSARGRDIRSGPYDDFIQTDAPINKGNSGGPMFDVAGQVIGVNTAIYSPSGASVGIGFAIPSDQAKPVIAQLRETGKVRRGWLGVHIQTVTDEIADNFGLSPARGALVASLNEGSPAKKAGIQPGDIILSFDGKEIKRMRSLPSIVAETPVGKSVPVSVWRKGKEETMSIVLGELPEDQVAAAAPGSKEKPPAEPKGVSELGMTMTALTDDVRQRFQLDKEVNGVLITAVAPNSSAAERGISPGDIILQVQDEKVSTPGQIQAKVAKIKKDGGKTVVVLIQRSRGGQNAFVPLKIG
ncbi:MAG: DegQ family serine endoprotease [Alphaproteobacteria bacterium]